METAIRITISLGDAREANDRQNLRQPLAHKPTPTDSHEPMGELRELRHR